MPQAIIDATGHSSVVHYGLSSVLQQQVYSSGIGQIVDRLPADLQGQLYSPDHVLLDYADLAPGAQTQVQQYWGMYLPSAVDLSDLESTVDNAWSNAYSDPRPR